MRERERVNGIMKRWRGGEKGLEWKNEAMDVIKLSKKEKMAGKRFKRET